MLLPFEYLIYCPASWNTKGKENKMGDTKFLLSNKRAFYELLRNSEQHIGYFFHYFTENIDTLLHMTWLNWPSTKAKGASFKKKTNFVSHATLFSFYMDHIWSLHQWTVYLIPFTSFSVSFSCLHILSNKSPSFF